MELRIEGKIKLFELKHNYLLPDDLKEYFKSFEKEAYNKDMFDFYGFDEFKSVFDEVGHYNGAPNYTNIVNTLPRHEQCFVFAEYFTHLCVYAIRLHEDQAVVNEVYVIMGDSFSLLADSFTKFLTLYNDDAAEIFM